MTEKNWLADQVNRSKSEIESWPQWKRDTLRLEISRMVPEEHNKTYVGSGDQDTQPRSAKK